MLPAAHTSGLGGVWLGETLRNEEAVRKHLGLDSRYERMAVLAIGPPRGKESMAGRLPLEQLVLQTFS